MRLKPINPEKELKKVQKKGIYNPKLKIVGIAGVIIGIALIYTTYAFFNYSSTKAISFNSQVDKKVNIEIEVKNGTTNNSKITTKYNQELRVKVNPNEGYTYESVICTNSQTGTYDKTNNELIIKPTIYTKCTVTFREATLREIILASNVLKTDLPDFSKGFPLNIASVAENYSQSGLYKTQDNDGDSYYFRGSVENNYVKFANKIWRVVRINGDKSIRLILNESNLLSSYNIKSDNEKYVGFTYDHNNYCFANSKCKVTYNSSRKTFTNDSKIGTSGTHDSTVKTYLENWYKSNLSNYDNYISYGTFCNDTSIDTESNGEVRYEGYKRITKNYSPILKCFANNITKYGGVYELKIGLITADELVMAGIAYRSPAININYLYSVNHSYTMTPFGIQHSYGIMFVYYYGETTNLHKDGEHDNEVDDTASIYPVINLNSNVTITKGNGTQGNPYVIK